MNSMIRIAVVTLTALAISGCSAWQLKYGPDKPQFSYVLPEGAQHPGSIYVWNPNTTVAYVTKDGKACIAPADVFKARNVDIEVGLKAGALKGIENLEASAQRKLVEHITKLSEKDATGTFLSIALFNVCMLSNNHLLTQQQIIDLTEKALEAASKIAVDQPEPPAGDGQKP